MKAIIYLRKSTDEKDRQVQSLESQKVICEAIVEKHKLEVVDTFDESKSAKKAGKRPKFRKMMDMVHRGDIDSIVVWKASRLSRNSSEAGEIIDLLNDRKLTVFHESGTYERGDSLLLSIELGFATEYVKKLSDEVKTGLDKKVDKGWRPGKVPLGYLNVGEIKGEKWVETDKKTAPYVRRMFDLVLAGKTVLEVSKIVTAEGLLMPAAKKRKEREIGKTQAYRLLKNPFYYGWYYRNGVLRKGEHIPLITKSEYDRVQELISGRAKIHKRKNDFWWMGLVRCRTCGSAIVPDVQNKKLVGGGFNQHIYAKCTRKRGKCSQPLIKAADFERQLKNFLQDNYLEPKKVEEFRKDLVERNKREFDIAQVRKREKTRRENDLFEKKRELWGMKSSGLITEQKFIEEKNKIAEAEASLEQDDITLKNWLGDLEIVTNFVATIKDRFENGDNETKREIMRIIGANLVLDNKSVWCKAKNTFEDIQDWAESDFVDFDPLEPEKDGSTSQNKIISKKVAFGAG